MRFKNPEPTFALAQQRVGSAGASTEKRWWKQKELAPNPM